MHDETSGVRFEIDGEMFAAYHAGDASLLRRLVRERYRTALRKDAAVAVGEAAALAAGNLYISEQIAQRLLDAYGITKEERLAAHPYSLGEFLVTRRGLSPEDVRTQLGALAISMLHDGIPMLEEREP